MQQTILEVKNLTTSFKTERGVMKAIDGINFRVNANEILGIRRIRLRKERDLSVYHAPV